MLQRIAPDDPRLSWEGAIALQRTPEYLQPWRAPLAELGLYPQELQSGLAQAAGVRIVFRSDTEVLEGEVVPTPYLRPIDCCCDGALCGSQPLGETPRFRFEQLPRGPKTIELWVPQNGEFRLRELRVGPGTLLEKVHDHRPRWITYGSSITKCNEATSPTRTWPARVARQMGWNLTCLGFGGQCHLDPMVARLIRDLEADFISLCVGINIYGAASLGPRAFRPALVGTLKTIRERHAGKPLAVLSPIYSFERETTPNPVGFTLQRMREEVAAAVETLRAHGDTSITYQNGLELLGEAHAHLLPDKLHPNCEGYGVFAENFIARVARNWVATRS